MLIQVHFDSSMMPSRPLELWIRDHLVRATENQNREITRVKAFVSDGKSGRSGPDDLKITFEARAAGAKPVVVTETGHDPYVISRRASDKLNRVLAKRFRSRSSRPRLDARHHHHFM